MNKLAGFEIETLSGFIERRTVFIDIYFPINSAFWGKSEATCWRNRK